MEETKYNSDAADPQVNTSSLDNVFGIDNTDNTEKQLAKIEEMRTTLENLESDETSTDTILLENIERANRLLDKLEVAIEKGDTSARLFEVAATLMNTISQATAGIVGAGNDIQKNEMQMRIVSLKEKEFELKKMLQNKKINSDTTPVTNNNILVTDRESLLKMIKEQRGESQ